MKALLTTLLLAISTLTASEPFIEKQDLFTVGDHPGYSIYHIPGVVVTARDTVLVWCEARKRPAGASDWDDIRILLRRNSDDGKSWSAPKSVVSEEARINCLSPARSKAGQDSCHNGHLSSVVSFEGAGFACQKRRLRLG